MTKQMTYKELQSVKTKGFKPTIYGRPGNIVEISFVLKNKSGLGGFSFMSDDTTQKQLQVLSGRVARVWLWSK